MRHPFVTDAFIFARRKKIIAVINRRNNFLRETAVYEQCLYENFTRAKIVTVYMIVLLRKLRKTYERYHV